MSGGKKYPMKIGNSACSKMRQISNKKTGKSNQPKVATIELKAGGSLHKPGKPD